MNNPEIAPHAPGLTLGDIYYALFRHKWKILLCSAVGLLAAVGIYRFFPPPAASEAKLFIRYVITEGQKMGLGGNAERAKSPDERGETIMSSEMEILTSLNLARQVAQTVGPEKILAKVGGGNDLNRAAVVIQKSLAVAVPPKSSVIDVIFRHPDPTIVQPVLTSVIDSYLKMHLAIHHAVGIVGDFLTQETDQLRSRLAQTEDDLRKARNKAGVISVDDSKKAFAEQIGRIRQAIYDAQAELAERSAVLQQIGKNLPAGAAAPTTGTEPAVPSNQIAAYRSIAARLELFHKREQELLTQFTGENALVKEARAQIADAESQKKKLEADYPQLAFLSVPSSTQTGSNPGFIDPAADIARSVALQAKIKVLSAQLEEVRAEAATADQMEVIIMELRRRLALEEENYKYYSSSLEQARIDEALGPNRVSNISMIQDPSPPFVDSKKFNGTLAMVLAGGLMLGLAWAFSIELYFDRSVRRPIDVERMLRVPLFLSIPDLGHNGRRRLAGPGAPVRLSLPPPEKGAPATAGNGAHQANGGTELVPPRSGDPALYPFYETLRDRLVGYFESVNLTHKPKLVAITGIGKDAGVTTIASGLAQCCSETGEGNVLLVDMTPGQGSAQQFYKGKAVCGLDEILETKDPAQVHENLYVVTEGSNSEQLSRILPTRFNQLVPKLKASDFDYIIFDMPPVSQISITPRLAGFMDMVLLTIESEKTDRDVVQRATTLLTKSKAQVGVILNKTKSYVPSRLHQEFLLDS
jgi:succinoglycan biosynthesis transport protein ExoP